MTQLHIITPCTRVDNLDKLFDSIKPGASLLSLAWWIVFDILNPSVPKDISYHTEFRDGIEIITTGIGDPSFIAGKGQINHALEQINDGYVYVLDDDNIIHPAFFQWFAHVIQGQYDAYFMAQEVYSQGPMWIRYVGPGMIKETFIDQAQYIFRRNVIGDDRFIQKYTADGEFAERIINTRNITGLFNNYPTCYYNYLRKDE